MFSNNLGSVPPQISDTHYLDHESKSGVKFPAEASKLGDVAATGMLASSRCKLIMQRVLDGCFNFRRWNCQVSSGDFWNRLWWHVFMPLAGCCSSQLKSLCAIVADVFTEDAIFRCGLGTNFDWCGRCDKVDPATKFSEKWSISQIKCHISMFLTLTP